MRMSENKDRNEIYNSNWSTNDPNKQNEIQTPKENNNKKAYFAGGVIAGVMVTLFMVCVVLLALQIQKFVDGTAESITSTEGKSNTGDSLFSDSVISKLETLEGIIDYYYYKDDVEAETIVEGAYRGMLDAVEDPYTTYYSAEELVSLMEKTEGAFYGIGAYIGVDTDTNLPKIVDTIPDTPAQRAGLRSDDIVYEVDGVSTYNMDLSQVVALVRGEEGSTVRLTIVRQGEEDYLYIDIERARVESPTVNYEMLEDQIAYIQIIEFDNVTVEQFAEALAQAKAANMKGLILDVRSNPGGNLSAVVDICEMLLPEGMIVYTENKYGEKQEFICDGTQEFTLPLVLLVDSNSASASEILAGAIKDYGMGTLVGTTTFGKGIVQQIINLEDGSAVKITVSSYYTPNGINIHGTGIDPDVVSEFDSEAYYNDDYDNQLQDAIEVMKEKLQ